MKIDTSVWRNVERLQERIRNLATMILSLSAVNMYASISSKNWFILIINILFFITTLPVFVSWSKFRKEPPNES